MTPSPFLRIAGGLFAALFTLLPTMPPPQIASPPDMRAYARATPGVRAQFHGLATIPAPHVPADTLRHTVRGGEVLIFALPAMLDRRPVERYAILQAPALSLLEDRSVMWRTRRDDAGEHLLLFQAFTAEQRADTVRVMVLVEP